MISQSPVITIILPVYNGAKTLTRAIDSIIGQTFKDWKLIILEDGSTDDTLTIAQKFRDNRICIISDGLHLGIVARLNQGVQYSESQYIARMDADDVSHPQRLEKQLTFLDNHPNIDLVGTAIRVFDKNSRLLRTHILPISHQQITTQPWLKTLSMAHPTWCGRTEWFQKWQYQEFMRNEDQALLLRAHISSTYANLPDVLLDYYHSPSFTKNLSARWGWITVLWSFYGKKGHILTFTNGLVITTAKIFRDILKIVVYKINIFGH